MRITSARGRIALPFPQNLRRISPRNRFYPRSTQVRQFAEAKQHRNNVAAFTSFPARLFHYSPARKADLRDINADHGGIDQSLEYHVSLIDGLVHSRVDELTHSNGPVFMPNTTFMQEYARVAYDNYLADKASGLNVPEPFIFCIARGTPIPDELVLLNERDSRFTLQPNSPVSLKDFNNLLDQFYSRSATKSSVGRWLSENDWADAYDEEDREGWMAA